MAVRRDLAGLLRQEGLTELARLRVIKGSTPTKLARRKRRAAALIASAAALATMPARPALASTQPHFVTPLSFGDIGSDASPSFTDIDDDGDLDAFIGTNDGNIVFFRN